jgi:hypothetical protein
VPQQKRTRSVEMMACMEKWIVFINKGAGNFISFSPNNTLLYLPKKKKNSMLRFQCIENEDNSSEGQQHHHQQMLQHFHLLFHHSNFELLGWC